MLKAGSLGLAGVTLPKLLWADAARSASGARARADSCILVFLDGGPSHLDMWDMKPDAPAEIRGEFQPIATSLAGVQFSEHLPRLAGHMHRGALIRSAHHSVNNAHAAAVYTSLTGHDRGDTTVAIGTGPNDFPAIGSITGLMRPPQQPIVPFVSLPYITQEGRGGPPQPGFFGGALGKSYDPLFVLKDPNSADFSIPELALQPDVGVERLSRRKTLQGSIDAHFVERASRGSSGMDGFRERAFGLLSSAATQRAFQLAQEPANVRDAYGRNIYGQSVLLARRLIEAGTRVVSIAWAPDANATWDTHGGNFKRLKEELLPQLDASVSSLLNDLVERGMLDRTLVVVMGEFGRTPKINAVAGRDHWNFCYGLMLAGGGIKPGFVYGASDKTGAHPADKPVTPADIIATIYESLGIPHTLEFRDAVNRPYVLVPWGEPLMEMFV
ncbi:MAG TPA: DUF1501 domain-containing protein [Planctomycetaceae bacterium]|nr:DUF1501 domain-containing protein [Planctomycetaceae bacterium]